MYMDGGFLDCQCGDKNCLNSADSSPVHSCPPPRSSYFQPFIFFIFFFTQGENEEEQNQHMKTKTWQRGEGWGRRGGGTEEGEAISENKRAFKSTGWKLVRLLFLKNDPCVVLLLRARYTLFYLPEETQQGVLAPKSSLVLPLRFALYYSWCVAKKSAFEIAEYLSELWLHSGSFAKL